VTDNLVYGDATPAAPTVTVPPVGPSRLGFDADRNGELESDLNGDLD
jgi:hypothetical protein